MEWKKSSYSSSNGTCWELATDGEQVYVRNSNRLDDGVLQLHIDTWQDLLQAAKAGQLDDMT